MSDEERWLEALTKYEGLEMGRRKVELNSIIRPCWSGCGATRRRSRLCASSTTPGMSGGSRSPGTVTPTNRACGKRAAPLTSPTACATSS